LACGDNIYVDRPPELPAPRLAITVAEDGEVLIDATATDPEGAALRYSASAPAHGALTGAGPLYTYRPAPDYVGGDRVVIEISDGLAARLLTVDIAVGEVDDAPVADDAEVATLEGLAVAILLEAHDVESTALTYTVLTQPAHGSLSGSGRTWLYTPEPFFYGEDALTFQASDSSASSNVATIRIQVANDIRCGDGVAEGLEVCDDGNLDDTDACLSACVLAACGDGAVQAGVEQCDDGNLEDDDACHSDCTLPAPPACGDGSIHPSEQCDDGNASSGDGCSAACAREVCGDGLIQYGLGETCDDGNEVAGDGCDALCAVEPFDTVAPVKISGELACTTAVANAARKIAVDGSGTIYAVMKCGTRAALAVSRTRGASYDAPVDLGIDDVSQVAVATGPSGVAYVAVLSTAGAVSLRATHDYGQAWGSAVAIGQAASTSAGLSLEAFNDSVFVGYSASGGVAVQRNHDRAQGAFSAATATMSIAFFDLLYDDRTGALLVVADTPAFHIRASGDAGATFAAEVNPPGSQYYSDWAIGNGQVFVSGTDLGSTGNSTLLYVIGTGALASSTTVAGLPAVTAAQTRSLAADDIGHAYIASQLGGSGIQLDRLPFGGSALDPPRSLHASGTSPVAAPLPGGRGAAVVFTVGSEVYATIQAY
jgi:cysteine-rich repeat protein